MIQPTNYPCYYRAYINSFHNANQNVNAATMPTTFINPYQQNTNSNAILNAMNVQGLQNIANINQTSSQLISNCNVGTQILNNFKQLYPNLESSSMLDAKVMQLKHQNAPDCTINFMQKLADNTTDKYVYILENTPFSSNFSDEAFINQIKENIKNYNMANCGERAFLVSDQLNKMGIANKIVEISGNNPHSAHVFNVIGLAPNADITKPETWGNNAVIIDTWANKTGKANDIIKFYREFLCYNAENQPMSFKEDTIEESRLSTLDGAQKFYEKKFNTPITYLQLGPLTFAQIDKMQIASTQDKEA